MTTCSLKWIHPRGEEASSWTWPSGAVSAGLACIRPCSLTPTSPLFSRGLSSSPPRQSELQTLSIRSADLLTLSSFRRLFSQADPGIRCPLKPFQFVLMLSSVIYFVLRKNLLLILSVLVYFFVLLLFFFQNDIISPNFTFSLNPHLLPGMMDT